MGFQQVYRTKQWGLHPRRLVRACETCAWNGGRQFTPYSPEAKDRYSCSHFSCRVLAQDSKRDIVHVAGTDQTKGLSCMIQVSPLSRLEDCKRVRTIPRAVCEPLNPRPLVILVAEKDPCDALLLEQALFQAGLHVPTHFVDDGQEAIEYLRGDPPFNNRAAYPLPTLFLLDLHLPRTSGFDLLRWLGRGSPLNRGLVVVLSSSAEKEDIRSAYALGADSYLIKPADAGELVNVAAHLKNYWLEMSPLLDESPAHGANGARNKSLRRNHE
jgi:CheY-like chemotaxis protein